MPEHNFKKLAGLAFRIVSTPGSMHNPCSGGKRWMAASMDIASLGLAYIPWSEHSTVDSNTNSVAHYYYNEESLVTTWDEPEEHRSWSGLAIDKFLKASKSSWRRYVDQGNGKDYYFDRSSQVTQWEVPGVISSFKEDLSNWVAANRKTATSTNGDGGNDTDNNRNEERSTKRLKLSVEEETEQQSSKKVQALMSTLTAPDSLLELDAVDRMKEALVLDPTFAVDPLQLVKTVSQSYVGYAQMVRMSRDWLELANKLAAGSAGSLLPSVIKVDGYQDEFLLEQVINLIKARFSRAVADSLVEKFSSGVLSDEWLLDMLEHPKLRRLLIDLYDQNKESALLAFILRKICQKGYYSEIGSSITEIGYFDVFSAIVVDVFAKVATAGGSDLGSLVSTVCRVCSSNEYMFLYSMALLQRLEERLKPDLAQNSSSGGGGAPSAAESCPPDEDSLSMELFGMETNAVRSYVPLQYSPASPVSVYNKFRRLQQEIERAACWAKRDASNASLTHEGAAAMALIGEPISLANNGCDAGDLRGSVLYEVRDMMKTNAVREVSIDRLHSYYLPGASVETAAITADVLLAIPVSLDHLRQPLVLPLLIDSLFHGEKKIAVTSPTFNQLVRLLVVACCFDDSVDGNRAVKALNTTIDRMQKLRNLCDSIISSAYGSLSFDQPQLMLTFVETPVLARCMVQWVRFYVNDDAFMTKTPNLALLPVFLQLVAAVSTAHPLQRDDCFDILKSLLKRSPSIAADGPSYSAHHSQAQLASAHSQTYLSCQKDAMETLVHLMGTGYVAQPLLFMKEHMAQCDLDNIRYFVTVLLDTICKPYSVYFVSMLAKVLCENSCIQALSHSSFPLQSAKLLKGLLEDAAAASLEVADKEGLGRLASSVKIVLISHNIAQ